MDRTWRWAELAVAAILLLAIGVILVPVIGRPHGPAHDHNCLSNVKQLAVGFALYAEDNGGTMPPPGRWTEALACCVPDYHEDEFLICPQDTRHVEPSGSGGVASYAVNPLALARGTRDRTPDLLAGLPLLFDATALVGTQSVAAYRHPVRCWGVSHEGLNVGFGDGHVKWLEKKEFEKMNMAP
jgi:prepilin-type processing-associated H-X9-DG protein